MQDQPELNFNKAENEKNVGILMSGSGLEEWNEQAYLMLKEFLKYYMKNTFLAERIRQWCYEHGLPRPSNDRAWGSVIIRAQRNGLIAFERYEKTINPKAHRTPAAVWSKV